MNKLLAAALLCACPTLSYASVVNLTLTANWEASDYDVSSTGPGGSSAPEADDDKVFGFSPSAGSLSVTLQVDTASGTFYAAGSDERVHDFYGYTDVSIVGGSFSFGDATWTDSNIQTGLVGADGDLASLWTDGDLSAGASTLASFRMISPWEDAAADIFFGSRIATLTSLGSTAITDSFLVWEYFGGEEIRTSGYQLSVDPLAPVPLPASSLLLLSGLGGLAVFRRKRKA